jgi:hypothetical protein
MLVRVAPRTEQRDRARGGSDRSQLVAMSERMVQWDKGLDLEILIV